MYPQGESTPAASTAQHIAIYKTQLQHPQAVTERVACATHGCVMMLVWSHVLFVAHLVWSGLWSGPVNGMEPSMIGAVCLRSRLAALPQHGLSSVV